MTQTNVSTDSRIVAPYITAWSGELEPQCPVTESPRAGLGYVDEITGDRDSHGVLWGRVLWRPEVGRPVFGKVHPARQRRVMRKLLCQVCAGPADLTDEGLLFLVPDRRGEWPGWPNEMGSDEPPVCRPCARLSAHLCPELRAGAVLIRAGRYEIVGVTGYLYAAEPEIRRVGEVTVSFDNPAVRWVMATGLIRELFDCTLIELDEFNEVGEVGKSVGVGSCRS
jgi:hypothetical protein